MYEIYINERKLILCSSEKIEMLKGRGVKSLVSLYRGNKESLFNYIDALEKGADIDEVILHAESKKQLIDDFKSIFTTVTAGGGLVVNEKDEILFIFRKGSWDLPKGKLNSGETKRQGALREVWEETGAEGFEIITKLCKTRHSFKNTLSRRQIKKSHWYLMKTHNQDLIPQLEEDITEAVWMSLDKFYSKDRKVYKSILSVLKKYELFIKQEVV